MKPILTPLIFVTVFVSSSAFAHDAKLHHNNPVEGKVTKVSSESAEISTDKGPVILSFTPETKFETGMDGNKAAQSDLKVGEFVMASGTKLSASELSASEVMIHTSADETSAGINHTHH